MRGIGAIGSARPSQGRGTGIETQILQSLIVYVHTIFPPINNNTHPPFQNKSVGRGFLVGWPSGPRRQF